MSVIHHHNGFSNYERDKSFDHMYRDDSYWFDFENPSVHNFDDNDDCRSQSIDLDLDNVLLPVARENERLWHEQKPHPSPEHSMLIDVAHSDSSWSADDVMHLDSGIDCQNEWSALEELERPMDHTEPSVVACAECGTRFDKYQDLERHGKQANHLPFACEEPLCNKRLPRRDTMQRHTAMHRGPQFSCEWCKAKGVSRSFTRKDRWNTHLTKCPYRPIVDHTPYVASQPPARQDPRKSSVWSATPSTSFDDVEMKRRKIKEFMGPMLPRNEFQTLQHRLNTLDPVEMQDLYMNLARTVLGGTSAETRRMRRMEVSS